MVRPLRRMTVHSVADFRCEAVGGDNGDSTMPGARRACGLLRIQRHALRALGDLARCCQKLADRGADLGHVGGSTKEVRTLIDDVRSAVNTTVMATETGSKAVDRQFGDVWRRHSWRSRAWSSPRTKRRARSSCRRSSSRPLSSRSMSRSPASPRPQWRPRQAPAKREPGEAQSASPGGFLLKAWDGTAQPPPPTCGARAATGPTIRSKSAFPPALPWIGTCVATSSLSRLMLRNKATALALTFATFPPAGGGP
jgi:hypothetical protein